ncbi:MAG TPA: phage terminase large subunit family protein [Gaiellaceae bacterium]
MQRVVPLVRRSIFARELREAFVRLEGAQPGELARDFLTWSERLPTVTGAPLDFDRFPFQRELYRVLGDLSVPDVSLMKGTQIGASELLARLTLYVPDTTGETALYVFPALRQMQEFGQTRIDRLLEHSAYLRARAGRPWNRTVKRIGPGDAMFRGSQSKNDLISISARLLVLDEYDSLSAVNVPEAEQRVAGSELGLIRRVGVPSDPEFGIARRYHASDQRRWIVACKRCGQEEALTFERNVEWDEPEEGRISNARVVCGHVRCRHPLDVRHGSWEPTYPDRPYPGFHVHRLMVRGANLVPLIEASRESAPYLVKSFHNNGLGLPYAEDEDGLDRATLAAAVSAGARANNGIPFRMQYGYDGQNLVTAGVDVASVRVLNVRVSEHLDDLYTNGHRKRALFIGTVDSFSELEQLLERYRVSFAVIDGNPDRRLALGLAERHVGKIYICDYARGLRDPIVVNTDTRHVSVDRVIAIDAMIDVMRQQRNLLPEGLPDNYADQMIAIRRRLVSDQYGDRTAVYESTGADDYAHAETYDLVATEVAKVSLEYDTAMEDHGARVAFADHLEYRRSQVADYDSMEYRPGPGESDPEYRLDGLD